MKEGVVEKMARAIYESHEFVRPWDHPKTKEMWHAICLKEATAALYAYHDYIRENYT